MRRLKVYGWLGMRSEAVTERNHHGQTREIVAAHSLAEVARITGLSRYTLSSYGGETGNKQEIELAMSKPGTMFWKPVNGQGEFMEAAK
jgi:hypothetical protein